MKIAVLSDSHDNVQNLEAALALAADAGVGAVFHCGDLCSPFMVERLGRLSGGTPVHIVWGNNEGDIRLMCNVAARYPNVTLHGELARITIGEWRVAVNHYPDIARPLAKSGDFDLVCYGHDHRARHSKVGDCVLLNPGELLGLRGKPTCAWFDVETGEVEFVEAA